MTTHDERYGDPEDGSDPRPVRRSPMIVRLLVVLVGVFGGVLLVDFEVARRDSAQGADDGQSAIMRDERLTWTGRPHFENSEFGTRLDRFGNRNPDIPEDAPLDEVRIAGFGQSQLYGAGGARQEWLWNYHLEELLQSEAPGAVRVINGSVMGYSTLQACRRAALLLDALEPDLVFVVAGPGAQLMLDPSPAVNQVRYGAGADDFLPKDVAAGWPAAALPFVAGVHQACNAWSGIYRRHRAKFQAASDRGLDIQRWTVSKMANPPAIEGMIAATLDEAEALNEQCLRRGIELRVLVLPEIAMGTDDEWQRYLRNNQSSGAPPVGTPRAEPSESLEEWLHERGLATWNFFDEVSRMGPDRPHHTMADGTHWSEAGHEVIALGILRRLQSEGLIDDLAEGRAARPRTRAFGRSPFAMPTSDAAESAPR